MAKNKYIKISLFFLFIMAISPFIKPSFGEEKKLTIVFSGNMRGEIENLDATQKSNGGISKRANYVDSIRKEVGEILLLDTGDILPIFSPDFDVEKLTHSASISLQAMDIMGYDAIGLGESDIALLDTEFLTQKQDSISFSLLSANIVDKETGNPFFMPYLIKTMQNGLRVGIIGIVNEHYIIDLDKVNILPHKEVIAKYIQELKTQSDIVVVLGHLGLPYSIALANSTKGIDVLLSGHWDTESQEPIKIGETLVMPASYHSRKIGRIDILKGEKEGYSYNWESTLMDERYKAGNKEINDIISKMPQELKMAEEVNPWQIERIVNTIPLKVLLFYKQDCSACMSVEKDIIPTIKEKYGDKIEIEFHDINVVQNYADKVLLERLYGVKDSGVPVVIVSRYLVVGKEEIAFSLDKIIDKALNKEHETDNGKVVDSMSPQNKLTGESIILSKFESFSVLAVLTAGLLDGINPCAFTTIVFFISFLAFCGYKRREMFFAGTSFTLAVFITYLLIGMGIFRVFRSLKGFNYISNGINILIACLAFLLGVVSLIDYFKYRKTKDAKGIILKLPQSIRNRIHSLIGADFRESNGKKSLLRIIWIAFTAGFIVSILESFCTGQVYLPTIAFVLKIPVKRISAFLYLVIYNLAFIVPLVVVFLLGLFGVTSSAFSKFIERHLGIVKLSTAGLFFLIGMLLIILS